MGSATLLEMILIIYIIVINVLGVIAITTGSYASRKVGETIFFIWLVVAIPIALPIILYEIAFDKWKHRKRKQDSEKELADFVKEKAE